MGRVYVIARKADKRVVLLGPLAHPIPSPRLLESVRVLAEELDPAAQEYAFAFEFLPAPWKAGSLNSFFKDVT
jgi:hypothetical protein